LQNACGRGLIPTLARTDHLAWERDQQAIRLPIAQLDEL
jgi:hypothetical protein